MASTRCMNVGCGAMAAGGDWRRGWPLRSGGFATLCDKCGMAFEQSVFCDMFHQNESGWRECLVCAKRLHCGCIASTSLFDLLDGGGIQCTSCMKNSGLPSTASGTVQEFFPQPTQRVLSLTTRSLSDEKTNNDLCASLAVGVSDLQPICSGHRIDEDPGGKGKAIQLAKNLDVDGQINLVLPRREGSNGSLLHVKREQMALLTGQVGNSNFPNIDLAHRIPQLPQGHDGKDALTDNMICESLTQACLSISLGSSNKSTMMEPILSGETRHVILPPSGSTEEGRDHNKGLSASQQAQRARHLLPKPPKTASEPPKEMLSHMRVARPPAEGRGRNQLLPRYWPRITDQELQQISGDSNSTIVPLFEKVLSASDAGRIGRLVLPKACAEAYFPPISQPEGLPLKIQDAKGKDWHFQFRFWPNNNSRMYVLEGVTPCIQSLQLQAGDTVTFSRMDPEGKLVMGFRKATNSVTLQDSHISAIANAGLGSDAFFSGVNENLPISGYSGFLQSLKGNADPHLSCLSEHLKLADEDVSWLKTDKHGGRANEEFLSQSSLTQDKRRNRNIGSKSKRLHIDNEDALELKISWEEAQDLLRPPPSAKPSIVVIDDQEFEEYEEPPVFGKRTIFTVRVSGDQDQWIQCDDCFKWRRLPIDILVPSNWTCNDITWDPKRSSCAAPSELSPKEMHNLLQQNAEAKRCRTYESSPQNLSELDLSSIDTLANAAVFGDQLNQATASPSAAAATTTKHPRHRPGCTCIVCIQPPSGKGPKHHPNCTCNVCMTVKRRFKTLMMRKKKRQSEREEAEASRRTSLLPWGPEKEEAEGKGEDSQREEETEPGTEAENSDLGKGQIDLNCQPEPSARVSMMSLLQVANLPLENYLKQNGLTSLACEQQQQQQQQQVSSSSISVPQMVPVRVDESEERTPEDVQLGSTTQEQELSGESNAS